ncbi:EamA family transporter [[Clostridium] colinum]|uniref:EamA family transporter n=1 Tax=[Clostridium] colinum TaxID=36835 RepID=UPI002024253D|nr:EamA family transporter [[Clostridium] colinum]
MWIIMAILSAIFAGLTAILAKCGIKKTDSDVATFIRTIVILAFSWLIVFIVGSFKSFLYIDKKSFLFLILSGLSTGVSWLCYFKALSIGDVNKVVVIDKSSIILTVLFAILILKENENIFIKIFSTLLIGLGTFMMIEKKNIHNNSIKNTWILYAILSAIFASLTSIFAKIGISNIESNLATAIRTFFVLIMAFIVLIYNKKIKYLKNIDKKEMIFIILSGLSTGISWLCYYYAIQNGIVSVVVPIDKLSILVSIVLSFIIFKEKLNRKSIWGLIFIIIGTLLITFYS